MAPADETTPATPTQPAAPAAVSEDAFLKRLKGLALYTDMFSNAAANIDAKRSDTSAAAKMVTAVVPAVAKEGLEAFMRNNAAMATALLKEKGAMAHPATKYLAEESAKLSDDDFRGLVKPLHLTVLAVQKAKLPAPQAPRAWVGDKPKPF